MGKLILEHALLPEGWATEVVVDLDAAGRIESVEAGGDVRGGERVRGAVVPGMPNLHGHAHQRAIVGRTQRAGPAGDSFWTWRAAMYRALIRMTPEAFEAIAAQCYVELLEGGYTAIGEFHYLHHQADGRPYDAPAELGLRALAAARRTGIGVTLLPALYAASDFGGAAPTEGQRRFVCDGELFARIVDALSAAARGDPNASVGIAPHSLRAVPPELLAETVCWWHGLEREGRVHIHVAEQRREVEACLAWSGRRPVEWLLEHQPVDARWCPIHCTHLTPAETTDLAASGAVVGLCPTTEADLGDGLFPARAFLDAGGRFGVGSDSHVSADLAAELRLLEYGQRLTGEARCMLADAPGGSTARVLLARALAGGAQALDREIGAIAPGRRADLVTLDLEDPTLAGSEGDGWLDAWIFGARRSPVRAVRVGGRLVVEDGRHVAGEAIAADFRRAMRSLELAS
jgi:formimidoylglutamate deiminase